MRLEHHLVGGYVRYISPHIIIIINQTRLVLSNWLHLVIEADRKSVLSSEFLKSNVSENTPTIEYLQPHPEHNIITRF